MERGIEIVLADLTREAHRRDVVAMTNAYALDPMAGGVPLSDDVTGRLVDGLRRHPTTLIFLAHEEDRAIGIATCFLGFSTFHARSLINVHDLCVLAEHRGRGVGRLLLRAIEQKATELDCCKITLEVVENNRPARALYEAEGFAQAVYGKTAGGALFYTKPL